MVSLLGGLTRNYAANPYDVIHRLAERIAAQAYVMPVPFFANSVEDREVLLEQRGVHDIFEFAKNASLKFVGIGTVDAEAQLVSSGMIEPARSARSPPSAVSGNCSAIFSTQGPGARNDADGRTLAARSAARRPAHCRRRRRFGKVAAIAAVLMSHRLTGLITDEATAKALVGDT